MSSTRLSRLHPYPAMVADELAIGLSRQFVSPGMHVWDPFCGSGRFLAASAHFAGVRAGADVNPLACLLSRAKLVPVDAQVVLDIAKQSAVAGTLARSEQILRMQTNHSVQWFSRRAMIELSQIVRWINRRDLDENSKLIVAAALSATARDVSYARKSGWKLHRLSAPDRRAHRRSAWEIFTKKLQYCALDLARNDAVKCSPDIRNADSRHSKPRRKFDVVMTSPPYGDSRTTVQYGAASGLSLPFVSHIHGLEDYDIPGREIDRNCLGSGIAGLDDSDRLRPYWAGAQKSAEARCVRQFLVGYADVCTQISKTVKPDGRAILVLGRRSTGGYRLKLDAFTQDTLNNLGLKTERIETRAIVGKRIPYRVNRFARSATEQKRDRGLLPSMREEIVMVFRKPADRQPVTGRLRSH